ncbi:MAG: sterol desaturase family protein [Rhodospirillaceae bacterium]|nr:sterol desaturase family protein [Rhodospirillaceae bacterium]MBT7509100.1 sterol desaturase family protein [Rhodospirillaceae bacterium]
MAYSAEPEFGFSATATTCQPQDVLGSVKRSRTVVWLDYGPLSYIFISPAQHQIHHSRLPEHRDKNCGFAFAFWDALFGTLYVPKDREVFPMGLGDGTDGEWHSIWRMHVWPVRMAAKLLTGREPLPDENVQRPLT